MKKNKKFDSLQMMRQIRDRLHEQYDKDPELRERHLEEIRKKYGIKPKVKNSRLK